MNELLMTGNKKSVGIIQVPALKLNVAKRREYRINLASLKLFVAKKRVMGEPE